MSEALYRVYVPGRFPSAGMTLEMAQAGVELWRRRHGLRIAYRACSANLARTASPAEMPVHGPDLPTIHEVRRHNRAVCARGGSLGDCIVLPPHLARRSYRS